jgi:hypothetical protein
MNRRDRRYLAKTIRVKNPTRMRMTAHETIAFAATDALDCKPVLPSTLLAKRKAKAQTKA